MKILAAVGFALLIWVALNVSGSFFPLAVMALGVLAGGIAAWPYIREQLKGDPPHDSVDDLPP